MSTNAETSIDEVVDHDDLCPICHLLLYRPVTTRCGHTLCSSCMAHWAEVSVTEQFHIVPLDEERVPAAQDKIEVKCPMCRTTTHATPNEPREDELREKYPQTYLARKEEEDDVDGEQGDDVLTIALYVGNTHQYNPPTGAASSERNNAHEWTFFVQPDRTDIIEEVRILLHPTFRPSEIVKRRSPYEISRLGWGIFTVTANVVLKHGYKWMSSEARTVEGSGQSLLAIEWMLSFDGDGSQGKARMKIKRERRAKNLRGSG